MTDCSAIPIGELLPHGPAMTLIDRLVEYGPRRSAAAVTVTAQSRFFAGGGVPAWVGIEYMAQTIAAHAGYEARRHGGRPAIGFLLGTRAYRAEVVEFPLGAALTIGIEPVVVDGGFGAFQCEIVAQHVLATAVVNTYRPSARELELLIRGGRP
jgi:predicted hotdog family 3-hydroxylacyl-ACP dehydratase